MRQAGILPNLSMQSTLFWNNWALAANPRHAGRPSEKDNVILTINSSRGRLAIITSLLLVAATAAQLALHALAHAPGPTAISLCSVGAAAILLAYFGVTDTSAQTPPRAAIAAQIRPAPREPRAALASRRKFDDTLAARLHAHANCALLLVDIDDFGRLNDQHGHAFANAILLQAADRLHRATPAADCVAHLFSDKFGVLVSGLPEPDGVEALALQLLRVFHEPFFADDITARVSVSIGIAQAPRDATDAGVLMKAATEALRSARAGGGGAWSVYHPSMRHNASALRRAMPDAIVQHEIVPYYQPIVDLKSGRVAGLEVLARWNHPARGMLSPDIFIPVADDAGLLNDITLSLLNDVAHDARLWPETLFFAINIAPNQLPGVIDFAENAPGKASLPFHRMEVELTETALITDMPATLAAVHALRQRGTRVVLDDFGTGHGNFHHLRAVPFDRLKVDKQFVLDILSDSRAEICISAIVQAAKALDIDVTAEGVSTPQIAARVIQLGCQFGQGELFSMPVPASEVPAILARLGTGRFELCSPAQPLPVDRARRA